MNGQNLLEFLREYWFVVIFIGSLVVTWTQFDARIKANETAIANLQTEVQSTTAAVVAMQQDVAYIKANIDFLKNYLTNK